MKDVKINLYRGFPETSGDTLEEMIAKGLLELIVPDEEGLYHLEQDVYSCHIFGDHVYNTLKLFSLSEARENVRIEEWMAPYVVELCKGDDGVEGYQPTIVPHGAPEFFRRTQKDEMLCIWTNEVLDVFAEREVPGHHQCLKQCEMEEQLQQMDDQCPFFHLYSGTQTAHFGFKIPFVVLTKEKIAEEDPWETVLEELSKGEKLNVWYQAQVHGNEPASCDGALAVLRYFVENRDAQKRLDEMNLIVIPRANPEAAYLYRRMTFDNIDINRDHMACEAQETRFLHRAFQTMLPEVVLDGHEFTFFLSERDEHGGYVKKACEIMSSPATSLNIVEPVRTMGFEICGEVFDVLLNKGWITSHFGTSEKNPLGRVYYGLHQCLSFLIETRGIGGGRYGFDKRVKAQKDTVLAYIEAVVEKREIIKALVAQGRKNKVPGEEVVLHHGQTGTSCLPYRGLNEAYYLDGSLRERVEAEAVLKDIPLRKRSIPKGYVLPAETKNLDRIIENVLALGCTVDKIKSEEEIRGRQYLYDGLVAEEEKDGDILLRVAEEACISLPQGGYFFRGEGFRCLILSLLMEPDVADTTGMKGTLFQQGLLSYDQQTGGFPLYRVE